LIFEPPTSMTRTTGSLMFELVERFCRFPATAGK